MFNQILNAKQVMKTISVTSSMSLTGKLIPVNLSTRNWMYEFE